MALSKLQVQNYQSLESAEVDLGRLTVLVGPSNSGKSAVLRAIRTLVRNAASPAFVTTGHKQAVVRLTVDDVEVILERGKGLSTYRLLAGEDRQDYPKSGKEVPSDIQSLLAMKKVEDQDLNFAFQFDRPFLLDETSTQVAKVLGDLSNINILYSAVREANRRRLDVTNRLKVRTQDVETLTEELRAYTDLPARRKRIEASREEHSRLVALSAERDRLEDLVVQVEQAEAAVEELQREMEQWPDVTEELEFLEGRIREHAALADLVSRLEYDGRKYAAANAEQARLTVQDEACDAEYHEALVAAGTCPLCGARVVP